MKGWMKMKQFRLLRPDEIECRVAQCNEKGASILLYKTARTDADLLDETVGAQNWENDFKLVDGVLYGGIGVDYGKDGKLIWKWDAGVESNTEAEKEGTWRTLKQESADISKSKQRFVCRSPWT